jgi:hypothetical protein
LHSRRTTGGTNHSRGVPRLRIARVTRTAHHPDLVVVPVRKEFKDMGRLCGRYETVLVSSERSVDLLPEQGFFDHEAITREG